MSLKFSLIFFIDLVQSSAILFFFYSNFVQNNQMQQSEKMIFFFVIQGEAKQNKKRFKMGFAKKKQKQNK